MPLHWPAAPPSSGSNGPKGQDGGGAHFHFILALPRELQIAGSSGKAPRPALPRGRSTPSFPPRPRSGAHTGSLMLSNTLRTPTGWTQQAVCSGEQSPSLRALGVGVGMAGGAQEGKPSSLKRTSSCAYQQEENKCHGLSCQPPTYCSCGFKR